MTRAVQDRCVAANHSLWTLVTVTYNSANSVRKYWAANRPPAGINWIVVDNASLDDSARLCRSLGATVVTLPRNIGFAGANNVGLAHCESEFVAFVNPDVRAEYSTLPLLEHAITKTRGLLAPQLLNDDGSVQFNGRGLPFLLDQLAHRGLRLPASRLDDYLPTHCISEEEPHQVAWLTGAVIASAAETFRKLGGWDNRYFIYYEDADMCLRAWQNEIPVAIHPHVRWVHGWARESASQRSPAFKLQLRSAARFFRFYPELLDPTRRSACRRYKQLMDQAVQRR